MTVAVAESGGGGAGAPEPEGAMTHFYHTLDEIFHQSAESEDTTSLDDSMITMNLCLPSGSPDIVKPSPGHRHRQQEQQQQQLLLAYNTDIGPALKRNINAWCQATGLPTSITVYVEDRVFKLHKYPLVSRSGYFKKRLAEDCKEVKLPRHYPGGPDVFELVVNFCYGSTILMDPSNVAALRCAAQFLDMSEEHGRGNLCERSDVYLTQVALQSWEDTMVVLLQCHQAALLLLPLAEQVRIVGRCVDALAHLACLEVLDPVERRDRDAPGSTSNESQFWREMSAAMAGRRRDRAAARDWWVQDLVCLPCHLFERVVAALRRQGMQERQVSQVVMMYAERRILACAGAAAGGAAEEESKPVQEDLVAAVVRLLPLPQEKEGCAGVVPVAFLFALLRCALASDPQSTSAAHLEALIASQLECAGLNDYLLPQLPHDESCEVVMRSMQRVVARFLAQHRAQQEGSSGSNVNSSPGSSRRAVMKVAKVWDQYLAEIAHCSTLGTGTFSELAETFPSTARVSHDLLYRAIHRYLTAHPKATEEERAGICRMLNCQKLSQEVCAHAVQNELMPLRMLVQAMFLQQLHTRHTLCEHLHIVSGSAARIEAGASQGGAAAASLLQPLGGTASSSSSFRKQQQPSSSRGRGDQFQYDHKRHHQHELAVDDHHRQAASLKADFEVTYSRLRHLEEELARMRQNLDLAAASAATVTAAAAAAAVPEPRPPQKMRENSHGQQKDGLAGGCLGQSSGLVLKVSRSFHKLRFVGSGFFWRTRTNNNVVVESSAANNSSSSCAATEAAATTAPSSSSLRSSSLRYPPHRTGADLTSASSTSLRWTSPSSSLTTFDNRQHLRTDAAAAVPSPRPPPPRRRRSMSADMAFH